ncbi:hypothetical protein I5F00_08470 [Proteus mirabilis]|uniref:hypothetical protein n=1 Tax=Proteus mirabilis TaxID=584 RepID=UPI0018C7A59D|nr:hypothetical protein [Proteus mirabilis]
MEQTTYNLWSLITYIVSALIALGMLWRVKEQIKEAVKSNRINRLNSLLTLEAQIAERRQELSSAGIALGRFSDKDKSDKTIKEEFNAAELRFNEATQMYLNGLDRLCFCVLKGYLDDINMRVEYQTIIASAVKDYPERFNQDSLYTNIIDVHNKWKRS